MTYKARAIKLKDKLDAMNYAVKKLIRVDELTEEELISIIDLYDKYEVGASYKVDDVFSYNNKLYEVLQAHTSQSDWLPDSTPALYLNMLPDDIIPEWVQPTGGHDAYSVGDKVVFNNLVYESLINGNSWSPTSYPAGWKEVK